jgi:PilZ domain
MRQYIRHPSDIPISYKPEGTDEHTEENLRNIGHGGLSFTSKKPIEIGTTIHIRIPIRKPAFEAKGIVSWCHKENDCYEVGVSFATEHTEFRVRMVEQVCYIEHYKKEILEKEDRFLSGKEAAEEWVSKNAAGFPH